MAMQEHNVGPDGYCFTCQQIPCRGGGEPSASTRQLDRIEWMLRALCRRWNVDIPWAEETP